MTNQQIAEALGWTQIEAPNKMNPHSLWGYPPVSQIVGVKEQVPDYSYDLGVVANLLQAKRWGLLPGRDSEWAAFQWTGGVLPTYEGHGNTICLAVCDLIKVITEAGGTL